MTQNKDCIHELTYCRCDVGKGAKSGIPIAASSRIMREIAPPVIIELVEDEVELVPDDENSDSQERTSHIRSPSFSIKDDPAPSAEPSDESPVTASTPVSDGQSTASSPAAGCLDCQPKASKRKNHKKADRSPQRQTNEDVEVEQNAVVEPEPPVELQPTVVELPPLVKCRVCSNDIQPMEEVYYMWRCLDQCAFHLHKGCLHEEMTKQGFKKKREFKDATCATEGCSAPIVSIHEYDMQNKETLYIKSEHEKVEKAETKKYDKLKHTLAKDQQKKGKKDVNVKKVKADKGDAVDNGDSNHSSTRQSVTPEEQVVEENVVRTQPVIFMPAISSVTMPQVAVEKPVVSNPLVREINEKAVPLMKKKDEVESKYTVTEQKSNFVKPKKKNKKEIIDVFHPRPNPNRLPSGGFDESPPAAASFGHVPDSWDEDRSGTDSTSIGTSQFSDTVLRIHDPAQFPDNIDGTATFPLPGSREGEEFMRIILSDIDPLMKDIAINVEMHQEGANRPISELLDTILIIADKLQPSQVGFLQLLFVGEDQIALRHFIHSLKYFTVAKSSNGYTYCQNREGRALHQQFLNDQKEALQQLQQAAENDYEEEPEEQQTEVASNPWSFACLRGSRQPQEEYIEQRNQPWQDDEQWQQVFEQPHLDPDYDPYDYDDQDYAEQQEMYYEAPQEQLVPRNVEFTPANPPRLLKRPVEQGVTASSSSSSDQLVNKVMSHALSGSQQQRDKELGEEEIDKKIAMKFVKLELKKKIQLEVEDKKTHDGWIAEDLKNKFACGSQSQENAWGNGDNAVIPSFRRSEMSSFKSISLNDNPSDNRWREIHGKQNQDHFHPGFEQGPLTEQPADNRTKEPVLQEKENMVPEKTYLTTLEDMKRSNDTVRELNEKMIVMQRQLDETQQKLRNVEVEKESVVSVCHEKDKHVRSLNIRLDEQNQKNQLMEKSMREAQLQAMKTQALWDIRSIESSIRHNGDIVKALLQCSGPKFEQMVEELSENHRSWESLEQIARKRLELLEEGVLELPGLPSPPMLSNKVMEFFQMSVDYSKHSFNSKLKEYFPLVKAQLEEYATASGKDMPTSSDIKSYLLNELQTQPTQNFDWGLTVRRLASKLGFRRFEDFTPAPSSNNSSRPASSQSSRVPSRVQSTSGRSTPNNAPVTPAKKTSVTKGPIRNGNGVWGASVPATDRSVDMAEVICEICLDPMLRSQTLHCCELCKEPFHRACVLEWLDKEATCPHCRGNMPHPGHFPDLR